MAAPCPPPFRNPGVFPVATQQGYNLMLAGHTHGEQIAAETSGRFVAPEISILRLRKA
jgi:predicted MPP superfamily phosphohydrolase